MKTKSKTVIGGIVGVFLFWMLSMAQGQEWYPKPGQLCGRIIQITNDGALVDGAFKPSDKDARGNPTYQYRDKIEGTFFLRIKA